MAAGFTLKWRGREVEAGYKREAEKALADAVRDELAEMNKYAPRKTGRMIRTSRVRGRGLEREIAYVEPYAVVVHERLNLRHASPRMAKWAEIVHRRLEESTIGRIGAGAVRFFARPEP